MTVEEIFRAIKQLPAEEQKLLYDELSKTIDNAEGELFYELAYNQLTEEQYKEIHKRYDAIKKGDICLIEIEDHFYHLQNL